jgi:hypothetical protein
MFRKMRFIIWSKTRRIKVQNHYHTFKWFVVWPYKDGKVLIIRWVLVQWTDWLWNSKRWCRSICDFI